MENEINGFVILKDMCEYIRNESGSSQGYLMPITNRLSFIMEILATFGLRHEVIPLRAYQSPVDNSIIKVEDRKLANVMLTFKANSPEVEGVVPTVVFTAHHDIANPNSENCQDNTASLCNLLDLCLKLKYVTDLKKNVTIVFTDGEEFGGMGMNKLISQINQGEIENIEAIYALELTANGTDIWVSGLEAGLLNEQALTDANNGIPLAKVRTPYNESFNAMRARIPAVCLGILPKREIALAKKYKYPPTWALCHSPEDTFLKSANEEDMDNFVQFLLRLTN